MTQAETPFEQAVLRVLLALTPGEVVTYGEVAEEAGYPGRARAVGHLLARGPRPPDPAQAMAGDQISEVPWWRVVAANGRLVPGMEAEHARRLRAEGVHVGPNRVVGLAAQRRLRRSDRAPGTVAPKPGKG
ncbi:MAG: MGMT family protein [Acidimicrobiales bacterium]